MRQHLDLAGDETTDIHLRGQIAFDQQVILAGDRIDLADLFNGIERGCSEIDTTGDCGPYSPPVGNASTDTVLQNKIKITVELVPPGSDLPAVGTSDGREKAAPSCIGASTDNARDSVVTTNQINWRMRFMHD